MIWLYGKHACYAAIQNKNRQIYKIVVTQNTERDAVSKLLNSRARIEIMGKKNLDNLVGRDAVHQGIAIQVSPLGYEDITYLKNINDQNQIVVLLDQVTDPQNVGAILRSCAAFGVKALIEQERHSPKETAVLAKIASGALEIVPRIHVGNLSQSMKDLQSMGFWTVGFSEEAKEELHKADLKGKIAIVMGSEGDGLRRLTEAKCDFHIKLPTANFSTLNVATATSVALYQTFLTQNN
jgi:23S rRNA (guanosine2251-2'-O)-methyltransferase